LSQPCCFTVRAIPAWALTTPSKLGDIWIAPCRGFPTAMFDYRRVYKLKCRAFRIHFFTSCNSGIFWDDIPSGIQTWQRTFRTGLLRDDFFSLRNLQPSRSAIPSQACLIHVDKAEGYCFDMSIIHCCLTSWHSSISQGGKMLLLLDPLLAHSWLKAGKLEHVSDWLLFLCSLGR
jgi:hypothetical protein